MNFTIIHPISCILSFLVSAAPYSGECEDPYPSLSDYHDYEPQLEFDDAELLERKPEEEFVGEG